MSKSKHGPALFEVFDKGQRPGKVRDETRTGSDAPPDTAADQPGGDVPAAQSFADREAETVTGPRGAYAPQPSLVAIDQGYLRICLGSRAAGLVAFGLLFGAVAVFAGGQWYGRQAGFADGRQAERESLQAAVDDDIAHARRGDVVDGLFDGVGKSPVSKAPAGKADGAKADGTRVNGAKVDASKADGTKAEGAKAPVAKPAPGKPSEATLTAVTPAPTGRASWVKGHTYVVIQSFKGDARQDAVRAQEYVRQQGMESEIVGNAERGFKLIATQGFNRGDPTQKEMSERFLGRVREIGKAYYQSGGGYKLEGYFAAFRADSW